MGIGINGLGCYNYTSTNYKKDIPDKFKITTQSPSTKAVPKADQKKFSRFETVMALPELFL